MRLRLLIATTLTLTALAGMTNAIAQGRPDPAALLAAQKDAMKALASMDGAWRGSAWMVMPDGQKREFVQTERMGPFLDGAVKVIEGRGHGPDGAVVFNAFGIVSYNPATKAYSMRSYAMGQSGDFALVPTTDGYKWEIPAGPMTIRYEATVKDGTLREVGDRIEPGKPPVRFFEMNLKRIGNSDWPAAGAIGPK